MTCTKTLFYAPLRGTDIKINVFLYVDVTNKRSGSQYKAITTLYARP